MNRIVSELRDALSDLQSEADREITISRRVAPRSYGSGYHTGYRDALSRVLALMEWRAR